MNGISFELHKGEIIGLAGVVGSGRTEFAQLLYGTKGKQKGGLEIQSRKIVINSPAKAVKNGFAFISEDHKIEGLITRRSIADNIAIINYNNCKEQLLHSMVV